VEREGGRLKGRESGERSRDEEGKGKGSGRR
jgi:hypothetical protein